MSEKAFQSLNSSQVKRLEALTKILHVPINTIEHYGGGSVRCMVAENFLDSAN